MAPIIITVYFIEMFGLLLIDKKTEKTLLITIPLGYYNYYTLVLEKKNAKSYKSLDGYYEKLQRRRWSDWGRMEMSLL
jgi:hypothetical protein